jgi:hypothetical protein
MNILFRILVLALLPAAASAGLLEYSAYGTPADCWSSVGLALNLKGVALPGQGLLSNPALMVSEFGPQAQTALGLNWRREYRSIEVFDSYSNSVGLRTTAINDQTSLQLRAAQAWYARPAWGLPGLAAGLAFGREFDFTYRYRLEERDAFYYLTKVSEIEGSGALYGYSGALAVKPLKSLSLGLGLTRLSGRPEMDFRDTYTDPTLDDNRISYRSELDGNRAMAGLHWLSGRRIAFGLDWRSSCRLSGSTTYQLNDSTLVAPRRIGLPSTVTAGFYYRPSNTHPAGVSLEYQYTPWQKLEDNLYDTPFLAAVSRFSCGISHRMRNGRPVRFGVSFANSYLSPDIGLARAGFGTELPLPWARADLAAGVGRRTYNYGQAFGTASGVTVTETMADFMLTFSLK